MMPKYIEAELLKQFIVSGLNQKSFGNDAVKILTEIEYSPAANVAPTSLFTHAFVRLGLNQAYPIEHLDFACNQVTVLESTNVHNTVSLKNVVLMTGDPVVHAQWVTPTILPRGTVVDVPHCSNCKDVPCGVSDNTYFCPACGAKMDEEATHAD